MNFMSSGSKINFEFPSEWRMMESSSGQGAIFNWNEPLTETDSYFFFLIDIIVFIKWFMNGAASRLATRRVLPTVTF